VDRQGRIMPNHLQQDDLADHEQPQLEFDCEDPSTVDRRVVIPDIGPETR